MVVTYRPKGAEKEFADMSVIPRGLWEPWGLYREPITEKTVAANIRKWNAGALRREAINQPFSDLIECKKTPAIERDIAPHPSLKPQSFMRKIVYAALPTGKGVLLDPFAGSGTTLAAAVHIGYACIGIEKDLDYYHLAETAIPKLAAL